MLNATEPAHKRVIVIGGGPGGATAAALLARAGVEVLLLERESFPRYHIGESLAASCRVVMELSGALEAVAAADFPIKRGALLRWGAEEDWTIDWSKLFGEDVSSWHVDRDVFDKILLDNAGTQGAEVICEATVKNVVFDGDRPVAVEWRRNGEPDTVIRTGCDFLIDASGRAGVLSNQTFRHRQPHEIFRNVAIWGYWEGGHTLPNTPEGGINILSAPDGWYWVIPLKDDRLSVGFVTHQSNFVERRKTFASTEAMLEKLVGESETVSSLLAEARFGGPTRVEQDFSYVADTFCGPGHFMVGDAACFLDPLLSTGVHLAMYSAMLAAASILAVEDGDVGEDQALAFYEATYRHTYSRLLVLVAGVYQQYQGKDSYFWLAQRMVKERESFTRPNDAFTELTSGLTDLRDAEERPGRAEVQALREEAERARLGADRAAAGAGRPGLAVFRLEASDLYDEETGLHLVTGPRLGLRKSD
ncbi:NAD(P)/FAD-dependent oxidoreductase [Kitasatospora sp. NPDC050543]|uniref:NAD(P)/FAD-dependent oxidoreductase n=1 Tax=Kitasatospora sp. NPDC050543 TaxID=3364054 RepID=UPI0037B48CA6